jgi:hypothetical protein
MRVFPNTHNLGPARFENLRAVGAFLVNATYDGNQVTHFSLYSEKGKTRNSYLRGSAKDCGSFGAAIMDRSRSRLTMTWQLLTLGPARPIKLPPLSGLFFVYQSVIASQ